ncbi:hypothetical protein CDAR_434791 [Caerostris darwini]|uniref:Uncharacterized protein n=1 Tax=Caerostris darwini TaxID=1538125 RepID=A0AAV4QGI7_9ARAC|nr:hypothetical protein CDAR_434791 [Caerostris darwini]
MAALDFCHGSLIGGGMGAKTFDSGNVHISFATWRIPQSTCLNVQHKPTRVTKITIRKDNNDDTEEMRSQAVMIIQQSTTCNSSFSWDIRKSGVHVNDLSVLALTCFHCFRVKFVFENHVCQKP